MKKGELYEGIVEDVEFPSKGYVQIEDRRVAVKGVIAGQRVQVRMKRLRREHAQAVLVKVLERSALENAIAKCPHFGACGGCFGQTMSYENQLQVKAGMVERLLSAELQKNGVVMETPIASPIAWEYRNKMEFSFGDEVKGGELALGMHRKNSTYDVVNTPHCQIVHPDMTAILRATVEFFQMKGTSFYHKMQHIGCLRHLVVRRSFSNGQLLVNLVATTQEELDCPGFVRTLCDLERSGALQGTLSGILLTRNDSLSDTVQSDETIVLYGQNCIQERLLGLEFEISPFSFFQTNSRGAQVLYEKVREYVGETRDKVIYDLYSGTGTIAQILAPVAKRVVGVEIVPEAVEAARRNAQKNALTNCEFLAGDVLKVLDTIPQRPDLIVVDPPRDGLHPVALQKILAYRVPQIVYISCKPTSLVRDLALFEQEGYGLRRAVCVDMFPQTNHVETICSLSRIK